MTRATRKKFASRIGAIIGVLTLATIFVLLGLWQLDRATELKASLVLARTVDAKTISLDSIATPNTSLAPNAINRTVSFSGRYVGQYKAANQIDGAGQVADWEVGVMQVGQSSAILVVRGLWSERRLAPESSQSESVTVEGLLLASQTTDRGQNSLAQISRLDSAVIIAATDLDLYDGYVLAGSEILDGAQEERSGLSAEKLRSRIPGFYWQHLSYVVIWWLMAAVVLYLPFYRRKVEP